MDVTEDIEGQGERVGTRCQLDRGKKNGRIRMQSFGGLDSA